MERKSFAVLFQEELRLRLKQEFRFIFVDQWNRDKGEIGLYIRKDGERAGIYRSLSDELQCYQDGSSIEKLVKGYLKKWELAQKEASGQKWCFFSEAGNHLYAGLLNRRWEPEHMACYHLGDLIGICVLTRHKDQVTEIYLPDEGDLKKWDMTAENLWNIALRNTQLRKPPTAAPLDRIVESIVERELQEDREEGNLEETLQAIREQPSEVPMYLLTNQDAVFGAACILYKNVMERIAETFQSDLIIIPSSIHEIIFVPCKEGEEMPELHFLKELLQGVNEEMKCREEVLSDFLYRYGRDAGKLSVVHNQKV